MLYPKVKWHEHEGVYSARYLGYTLIVLLFGKKYVARVFDPNGDEVYSMSSCSLASMKTSCRNSAINNYRSQLYQLEGIRAGSRSAAARSNT